MVRPGTHGRFWREWVIKMEHLLSGRGDLVLRCGRQGRPPWCDLLGKTLRRGCAVTRALDDHWGLGCNGTFRGWQEGICGDSSLE